MPDWDPMTTVLSYISRLAQSLTGLESCFISEDGDAGGGIGSKPGKWTLIGWLRVHDSRNIDSTDLRVRTY
jgi:hypothetical protein